MENKKSKRNKNLKYFFMLYLFFGSIQTVSYFFYLKPIMNWVFSDFIILFVILTPIVSLLIVWLTNYFNAQYPEQITLIPKNKVEKNVIPFPDNPKVVKKDPNSNNALMEIDSMDLIDEMLEKTMAIQRSLTFKATSDNTQNAKPIKNFKVKHTNWEAIHKLKLQVGEIAEILAYSLERNLLSKIHGQNNFNLIHVSRNLDTFPGYDILSQNMDGSEKYIEVKGTISNKQDNFVLSDNEYKAFLANDNNYFVYRIYDLNMATGAFSISIYNGQELHELFDKIPQSFQLKLKA